MLEVSTWADTNNLRGFLKDFDKRLAHRINYFPSQREEDSRGERQMRIRDSEESHRALRRRDGIYENHPFRLLERLPGQSRTSKQIPHQTTEPLARDIPVPHDELSAYWPYRAA